MKPYFNLIWLMEALTVVSEDKPVKKYNVIKHFILHLNIMDINVTCFIGLGGPLARADKSAIKAKLF